MTYAETWKRDGGLIIPGLIEPDALPGLREMAEWCLSKWHLHNPETDKPGLDDYVHLIFHINNPIYHEGRRELLQRILELAAHPRIREILTELFEGRLLWSASPVPPTDLQDETPDSFRA